MDTILILLIILIPLIAQVKISSSYNRYKKEKNTCKLTGQEVARRILDENGLQDIHIVEIEGAKNVLSAAALTYVAGVMASILQILRLLLIARSQDRDN